MRRKIIQLAGKTLVVSLPSQWAREHKLVKGDEVELVLGNNELTILTEARKLQLTTKLFLDCDEDFAKRRINTLYKRGVDYIEVIVKNPELLSSIRSEIQTLMGFEIIEQSQKRCVIKNIAQPFDENLNILIKRIFLVNLEMSKLVESLLQKKQKESLDELKSLESLNDKLTNVCKRILNKRINQNMDKTNLFYSFVRGLEKVGDEYYKLGESIQENKTSHISLRLIANINSLHRDLYNTYLKFSEEKASNFSKDYKKLKQTAYSLLNKQPVITHHSINLLNALHELVGPFYATII